MKLNVSLPILLLLILLTGNCWGSKEGQFSPNFAKQVEVITLPYGYSTSTRHPYSNTYSLMCYYMDDVWRNEYLDQQRVNILVNTDKNGEITDRMFLGRYHGSLEKRKSNILKKIKHQHK